MAQYERKDRRWNEATQEWEAVWTPAPMQYIKEWYAKHELAEYTDLDGFIDYLTQNGELRQVDDDPNQEVLESLADGFGVDLATAAEIFDIADVVLMVREPENKKNRS